MIGLLDIINTHTALEITPGHKLTQCIHKVLDLKIRECTCMNVDTLSPADPIRDTITATTLEVPSILYPCI